MSPLWTSWLLGLLTGAVLMLVYLAVWLPRAMRRVTTTQAAPSTDSAQVPEDALAPGTVVLNVVSGRGGRVLAAGPWGRPGEQVRLRYVVQWHDGEVSTTWAESLRQVV